MSSTPLTPIEPMVAGPSGTGPSPTGAESVSTGQRSGAPAHIEWAAATSCGLHHRLNEDAHSPPALAGQLYVVADGVGGGAMARTASRLLVARLHRSLDGKTLDAGRIGQAVLDADRAIARHLARHTEAPGAATLALCAPANRLATQWWIGWVGDCRIYRLGASRNGSEASDGSESGGGRALLLTRDDTFHALGETPPPGSSPGDPARMVGNGATAGANVGTCTLDDGELLMLCSDGVHKHVDDAGLGRVLMGAGPLAQRCDTLIALARQQGSRDDATVLLLRHGGWAMPRARDRSAT